MREFLGSFDYKTRPWAPDQGAPEEIGGAEIEFERLAGTQPDLILGIYSFIKSGDYKNLSGIAPTVAQSERYTDGATPWDAQLLTTGRALGREDRARRVVADVKAQFAAARDDHSEFAGKSITVLFDSGGSRFVLNRDDLRSQFFGDLGFRTPAQYSQRGFETNLSSEQLSLLDTDVIVLITDPGSKLPSSRLFRDLEVVREGRVVTLAGNGSSAGALGYNSPLSRPYLLKRIAPALAAAVDGDPATKVPAESDEAQRRDSRRSALAFPAMSSTPRQGLRREAALQRGDRAVAGDHGADGRDGAQRHGGGRADRARGAAGVPDRHDRRAVRLLRVRPADAGASTRPGSVFALAGATLGPRAGFFAEGFALMATYTLFTVASAAEVGLFGPSFLDGLGAGSVDWLIIALIAMVFRAAILAFGDIRVATRSLLGLEGSRCC